MSQQFHSYVYSKRNAMLEIKKVKEVNSKKIRTVVIIGKEHVGEKI